MAQSLRKMRKRPPTDEEFFAGIIPPRRPRRIVLDLLNQPENAEPSANGSDDDVSAQTKIEIVTSCQLAKRASTMDRPAAWMTHSSNTHRGDANSVYTPLSDLASSPAQSKDFRGLYRKKSYDGVGVVQETYFGKQMSVAREQHMYEQGTLMLNQTSLVRETYESHPTCRSENHKTRKDEKTYQHRRPTIQSSYINGSHNLSSQRSHMPYCSDAWLQQARDWDSRLNEAYRSQHDMTDSESEMLDVDTMRRSMHPRLRRPSWSKLSDIHKLELVDAIASSTKHKLSQNESTYHSVIFKKLHISREQHQVMRALLWDRQKRHDREDRKLEEMRTHMQSRYLGERMIRPDEGNETQILDTVLHDLASRARDLSSPSKEEFEDTKAYWSSLGHDPKLLSLPWGPSLSIGVASESRSQDANPMPTLQTWRTQEQGRKFNARVGRLHGHVSLETPLASKLVKASSVWRPSRDDISANNQTAGAFDAAIKGHANGTLTEEEPHVSRDLARFSEASPHADQSSATTNTRRVKADDQGLSGANWAIVSPHEFMKKWRSIHGNGIRQGPYHEVAVQSCPSGFSSPLNEARRVPKQIGHSWAGKQDGKCSSTGSTNHGHQSVPSAAHLPTPARTPPRLNEIPEYPKHAVHAPKAAHVMTQSSKRSHSSTDNEIHHSYKKHANGQDDKQPPLPTFESFSAELTCDQTSSSHGNLNTADGMTTCRKQIKSASIKRGRGRPKKTATSMLQEVHIGDQVSEKYDDIEECDAVALL